MVVSDDGAKAAPPPTEARRIAALIADNLIVFLLPLSMMGKGYDGWSTRWFGLCLFVVVKTNLKKDSF